jgi:hypothetical protein
MEISSFAKLKLCQSAWEEKKAIPREFNQVAGREP